MLVKLKDFHVASGKSNFKASAKEKPQRQLRLNFFWIGLLLFAVRHKKSSIGNIY